MNTRQLLYALLVLFTLTASTAHAQGVIIPRPCGRCPSPPRPLPRPVPLPNALPVKSIKFDTKIDAQVATTHVDQVFRNDTDATLEGTFFFPIPETASIKEFAIWDGNRRLVGEVRSREEARRIYDEIVRRQRDPGLLEYAGKNLFQASIFPVLPRSDKRLELTYTQVLTAEAGTIGYRYPLGTGRNLQPIGAISGQIEIEAREPVRNIYSPTHQIDFNRNGERRARVSFETTGRRDNQDFQLFYSLSRDDFGLTLLTYREPNKDGYFLLLISPKDDAGETQRRVAKDVVFVLDTSGSMAEAGKMEKARGALLFGLRGLAREDRFNVISFAGEERLMANGLLQADDAGRARGVKFVEGLQPTGGTNINAALLAAQEQFKYDNRSDRLRLLVFMTDGLPTVGESNVERIIANSRAQRVAGVRLFTFGVGYDVNTALLDKLASENGGAAEYVEPKEDLEVKVSNFFTKISYPVLTDLRLDMGAVESDLVYPREMPDLFRGGQLALIGRYRNASDSRSVRLRLTGRTERSEREFIYDDLRFPFIEDDNDFLPRLWATRRVGWLMEQIRTNGEARELRDEVVDLGTRYGIVTPYTSYLALESESAQITANSGGVLRRRAPTRPATAPMAGRAAKSKADGTRNEPADDDEVLNLSAPSPKPASTVTGTAAVELSKQARSQQDALRVEGADKAGGVRTIRGKTFYLRGDVWTDSDYNDDARLPETALVFASDEYFALIRREPRLAEFFALGEQVVVVLDNRVYKVSAAKG